MNCFVLWGSKLREGLVWTRSLAGILFHRSKFSLRMMPWLIFFGVGGLAATLTLLHRVRIEVDPGKERQREDKCDDDGVNDLPKPIPILADNELEPQLEVRLQDRLRVQARLEREEQIQRCLVEAERRFQTELQQEIEIERHVIEAGLRLEYIDLALPWHRSLQNNPQLPPESYNDDDGNDQYNDNDESDDEDNDGNANEDNHSPQRESFVVIEETTYMLGNEERTPQDFSFVDPDNEDYLITVRVTPTDALFFWEG